MKKILYIVGAAVLLAGCQPKPSPAEVYRAEKHQKDSVALAEQERSMVYYQEQLEQLQPKADSLLKLFQYERNEKYQDHGVYVARNSAFGYSLGDLRIMVRDDGKEVTVYQNGVRMKDEGVNGLKGEKKSAVETAQHLQIVIHDINELEKRIRKTSLEIEKYQKRLQKEEKFADVKNN